MAELFLYPRNSLSILNYSDLLESRNRKAKLRKSAICTIYHILQTLQCIHRRLVSVYLSVGCNSDRLWPHVYTVTSREPARTFGRDLISLSPPPSPSYLFLLTFSITGNIFIIANRSISELIN